MALHLLQWLRDSLYGYSNYSSMLSRNRMASDSISVSFLTKRWKIGTWSGVMVIVIKFHPTRWCFQALNFILLSGNGSTLKPGGWSLPVGVATKGTTPCGRLSYTNTEEWRDSIFFVLKDISTHSGECHIVSQKYGHLGRYKTADSPIGCKSGSLIAILNNSRVVRSLISITGTSGSSRASRCCSPGCSASFPRWSRTDSTAPS